MTYKTYALNVSCNTCTHYSGGCSGHHAVEDEWRDEAGLFCPGVRLHQLRVVTEEPLHVYAEQVGALHVVGQQHGAGHDDELEEKHSSFRSVSCLLYEAVLCWRLQRTESTPASFCRDVFVTQLWYKNSIINPTSTMSFRLSHSVSTWCTSSPSPAAPTSLTPPPLSLYSSNISFCFPASFSLSPQKQLQALLILFML